MSLVCQWKNQKYHSSILDVFSSPHFWKCTELIAHRSGHQPVLTCQSTFTLHKYLSYKANTSASGGRISQDIDNINLNIGLGISSILVGWYQFLKLFFFLSVNSYYIYRKTRSLQSCIAQFAPPLLPALLFSHAVTRLSRREQKSERRMFRTSQQRKKAEYNLK